MGNVKNGAYVRINMNYPKLMPTEKRIADILLKNAANIDTLSISDLADLAEASKGTVTRFCKRLGYNGYKDFRVSAIKDTHAGLATSENALDEGNDTGENLIAKICRSNARACMDTILLVDEDTLNRAVDILLSKKRIFFVGEGAVSAVIIDLQQKLLRVGLTPIYSHDQRIQRMQISLTGPDDAVVAIDFSGSKQVTVEMAQQASVNNAEVITICNSISSELGKWGNVTIFGPGRMGSSISATLAPRIALLCIVDCLFTLLKKRMGEQAMDSIRKTNDVIVEGWVK